MRYTITEREMAQEVNARVKDMGIDINIEDTGKLLDVFEDVVKESIKAGSDVKMRHFGTFTAVEHKARNRWNPATKVTEPFPAHIAVKFNGSDEFKAMLNA